jgi:hypothetical protein
LHRPQPRALRCDPDHADRHLGGERVWGLQFVRELPLHDRSVRRVLVPHERGRAAFGDAVVLRDATLDRAGARRAHGDRRRSRRSTFS